MRSTLSNESVVESFKEILSSLSEKENNVISRRVWLYWEKETLQNIWNSFSPTITRERVRQIEDSWIKKIWRLVKNSVFTEVQTKWLEFIKLNWWVVASDKLMNYLIKELDFQKDINQWILETILQSDYDILKSKQKLGCKIYFYLTSVHKSLIDQIYKEWLKVLRRKKDIMLKNDLFDIVLDRLKNLKWVNREMVNSTLELYDDIIYWENDMVWMTSWKILNPKTLKDKAVYVLKKSGVPMHFVDISNNIIKNLEENVKINTVHNELIRNNEFVLIWRWIYALKEWWFKPGTVIDVIASILEKKWEAMSTEEIIEEVAKIRNVKDTTVYMNLQNKEVIERVWRNYYQLAKK